MLVEERLGVHEGFGSADGVEDCVVAAEESGFGEEGGIVDAEWHGGWAYVGFYWGVGSIVGWGRGFSRRALDTTLDAMLDATLEV